MDLSLTMSIINTFLACGKLKANQSPMSHLLKRNYFLVKL